MTLTSSHAQQMKIVDYINYARYDSSNAVLDQAQRDRTVVFMGNSITEGWRYHRPEFMSSNGYINRGISGQTTDQMLLRFRRDVLRHEPDVVVILAGTNDLAQNSGPVPVWHIMNNIQSMAELATSNGAKVLLCSVLPAKAFPWRPGIKPIPLIRELNGLIQSYAQENDHIYVDYYSAMVDGEGGLIVPDYTSAEDLVHPNAAGYEVMEGIVQTAIKSVEPKTSPDYRDKVQTLDSTIETLYGVISGPAEQPRDWDLFRFLFTKNAQLIPTNVDGSQNVSYSALSPEGYVKRSGPWLEKNGFFEKEIHRVTETFGHLTHVFSTYESYRKADDEKPFARGINSIQLMNDGQRWWVVNIYWAGASERNPIPKQYLPR